MNWLDQVSVVRDDGWHAVPGYPNYERNRFGEYRSWIASGRWKKRLDTTPRLLKPSPDENGYLRVWLYHDGKRKKFWIHQTVLEMNVGPCPDGMESFHNNGIRHDNAPDNLRWDTRQANSDDKLKHGTIATGPRNGTKTRPDRVPRGARHGSKTKPESVAFGFRKHLTKFTEETLNRISELRATGLSQRAVGTVLGMSCTHVSHVERGLRRARRESIG